MKPSSKKVVGVVCALVTVAVLRVPLAAAQVQGIVIDLDVHPIEGALVTVQATGTFAITGPDGRFDLADATGSNFSLVAARKGFFNESTFVLSTPTDVMISLRPVPADDDPTYTLADPATCGGCHPDQLDQWTDSPMAKGGTNTWVFDIHSGTGTPGGMGGFVYLRDSVFAATNPNTECAACHQPQAWLEDPGTAMQDPALGTPGIMHGVSCDVCHKIADIDEDRLNFPGVVAESVTLTRPAGPEYDQVQYGVLGDVDFHSPGDMRASFQPQLVAEVCAACHQDKNDPDEDGDFEEANGVVSEPTYSNGMNLPMAISTRLTTRPASTATCLHTARLVSRISYRSIATPQRFVLMRFVAPARSISRMLWSLMLAPNLWVETSKSKSPSTTPARGTTFLPV
jgi:hypothetical protein